MHESWVGVSEDSMTIARHHSSRSQCFVHEFFDFCGVGFLPLMEIFQIGQPLQALLISKSMERSGKAIHRGRVGEIRVSKSRADQVAGMRRNITSLMIGVDGKIPSNAFLHLLVLVAHHVREVACPI